MASHRPADPVEARHRDAVLALLDAPGDPADRSRYDPGHLSASALVVRPGRAGPELLMIRHERLGRWLQPGGHLEPADDGAAAGAAREVAEETGLRVKAGEAELLDVDVHRIPAGRGEPAHLHFDLRFRFEPGRPGDDREPRPGGGVSAVAWGGVEALARSEEAGLRRVAAKLGPPGGRTPVS